MDAIRIIAGMKRALAAAMLLLAALACGEQPKEKPLTVPGEKLYTLKGKIVSRSATDNTLQIDHEAIPGFMEAMTMDYTVRGAKVAQLPPDGARISARLHATDNAYWITDVARVP